MPLYRAQISAMADSALPRDRLVNTLHFDDAGAGSDPQALCNDLVEVFRAGWYTAPVREVMGRFYEVGPPPQFPVAETIINPNAAPLSSAPREVALCLSYFSERNLPRRRGRIYLAANAGGLGLGVRPTAADRTKALALGQAFADLGGVDVDWVVYSQADASHHDVSDTWVDDEWDTMRSRGLRATTRSVGTPGS